MFTRSDGGGSVSDPTLFVQMPYSHRRFNWVSNGAMVDPRRRHRWPRHEVQEGGQHHAAPPRGARALCPQLQARGQGTGSRRAVLVASGGHIYYSNAMED